MKVIAISFILLFICAFVFFIYMMATGHGYILILPSTLMVTAIYGMISNFKEFVGNGIREYLKNINYNRVENE